MEDCLATLQQTYFSIRDNKFELLRACEDDEQRRAIQEQLERAQLNYFECRNKMFRENDAQLAAILTKAKAAQDEVEACCESLDNIAKTITAITKAVEIGSQLACMAA